MRFQTEQSESLRFVLFLWDCNFKLVTLISNIVNRTKELSVLSLPAHLNL